MGVGGKRHDNVEKGKHEGRKGERRETEAKGGRGEKSAEFRNVRPQLKAGGLHEGQVEA